MRLALVALLLIAGCSENNLLVGRDDTDLAPASDPDADDGSTDSDSEVAAEIAWWAVGGALRFVGGEPDLASAALVARYQNTDQDTCEGRVSIAGASPVGEPTSPIASAWEFQFEPAIMGACGVRTLSPILIGVGPIDPQLYPAMDRAGYPPASTSALGLYADPGSGWVAWGLTGTEAQLAGETGVPALPPLPDGTYTWVPLFLLPFDAP